MLEGIGLSAEQEELYLRLLSHPAQSVTEIAARHPERPPYATVALLDSLLELGMLIRLAGPPEQYVAVAPDVAVGGQVRARVAAAQATTQAIPGLMEKFWAAQDHAEAGDFIETFGSQSMAVQRWHQLGRAMSAELRAFDCPPYVVNLTDPSELQRLARGVTYRVVYTHAALAIPGRWSSVDTIRAAGEQARVLPDVPCKLAIFDDFAAIMPMQWSSVGPVSGIVVHRSPLLDSLSALFEANWQQAIPLGEPPVEPQALAGSSHKQQIIRLLTAGMGDDAIQRSLGVSASTVQRRVRDLMNGLGARTRFQAGYQLGLSQRPERRR